MNKILTFIIISSTIFVILMIPETNIVFAQESVLKAQDNVVSQSTPPLDSKIDRLINFIAMIATVFGIIIAIVMAFFTIRQITVDKDLKAYKKEIKFQKELIIAETSKTKKELQEITKWAKEKKDQIDKELKKPSAKKTDKELKALQKTIDELKNDIAYKRGAISVFDTSSKISTFADDSVVSNLYSPYISFGEKKCEKCGKSYHSDFVGTSTRCPHCGNMNHV